jgi:hypothetical protein
MTLSELLASDPAKLTDADLDPFIGDAALAGTAVGELRDAVDQSPSTALKTEGNKAFDAFRGMLSKCQKAAETDLGWTHFDRIAWLMACGRHKARIEVMAVQHARAFKKAVAAGADAQHGFAGAAHKPSAFLPPLPPEPPMPAPVRLAPPPAHRFDLQAWLAANEDVLLDTRRLRVVTEGNGAQKLYARGFSADDLHVLFEYHQAVVNWLAAAFQAVRHWSADITI